MAERRGQRIYQWIWTGTWCLIGAIGLLLSLSALNWAATLGWGCVSAALAVGGYCSKHTCIRKRRPRQLSIVAASGTFVGVALVGWVSALGPIALAPAAAAVLTSPWACALIRRQLLVHSWRRPKLPSASAAPPTPTGSPNLATPFNPEPLVPPHDLTDEQLCYAWRASFLTLRRLFEEGDLRRQAQLVARRQHYLDELERRNPHGFHRWLASGPRPAGNPHPYIASN